MPNDFTKLLLEWNRSGNTRQMPWKGEKDPYKIWLSEVVLQQTRVEQGLAYYEKFIERFPTIIDLAMAPDELVFKTWEGLGYYSRCRNLLATARTIAFEQSGVFPDSYEEILKLKGVGPYTAAAIASFAFGQPHAVLDGNVFRVLSRYFGISTPIDTPEGKKLFSQLAKALLYQDDPAVYNQAIMDFGAVVCKPQQPACETCILRGDCQAFHLGCTDRIPVKSRSILRRNRFFYYFILSWQGGYYIRQRKEADIWQNLHEWVLLERSEILEADAAGFKKELKILLENAVGEVWEISVVQKQQLTHQTISGRFIRVELHAPLPENSGYRLVRREELSAIAFPRYITRYLETHPL